MSTTTALPQLYSYGHALEMADDKVGLLRDSRDAMPTTSPSCAAASTRTATSTSRATSTATRCWRPAPALVDGLAEAGVLDENHPRMDGVCKPGSGYVFKPELTNNNRARPEPALPAASRISTRSFSARTSATTTSPGCAPSARQGHQPALRPALHGPRHAQAHDLLAALRRHLLRTRRPHDPRRLPQAHGSARKLRLSRRGRLLRKQARRRPRPKEGKWTFTGTLSHNPPAVRNKFGGRWLTTEFEAGDFITFGMFLVHASLDNRSDNRLRISSDSPLPARQRAHRRALGRHQPARPLPGRQARPHLLTIFRLNRSRSPLIQREKD
jgi:hypothetical protein